MFEQRKQNKYKAQRQTYGGRSYHSKKEAAYAVELDWRIKAGEVKEWEPQHKIELRVNGDLICNYFIDFKVTLIDGSVEYVEVKGFETDLWRLKWKLTKALWDDIYPSDKLVLVK